MADKKISQLTAISVQATTDLYETSANGTGSFKETRAQQNTYWNTKLIGYSGQDAATLVSCAISDAGYVTPYGIISFTFNKRSTSFTVALSEALNAIFANSVGEFCINPNTNIGLNTNDPLVGFDYRKGSSTGGYRMDASVQVDPTAGLSNGDTTGYAGGSTFWLAWKFGGVGYTSILPDGTVATQDYVDAKVPITTKGDLLGNNGSINVRLPVGGNTQILSVNSATESGLEWIDNTDPTPATTLSFLAYQSPQQTIPNTTETTVEFKQTTWNDGSGFSTSTYTYPAPRAVQQTFIFKGAMAAPGGGNAQVKFRMYQNSTVVAEDNQIILTGDLDRTFNLIKSLKLAQSDTVHITCTVTGNGGAALAIANGQSQTYFEAQPQSVTYSSVPVFVDQTGTSATLAVNTTNAANNASLVTLTLPTVAAAGDVISVFYKGAGGWKIAQPASVSIKVGNLTTTVGTGGSIQFTDVGDCIRLVCITADVLWEAEYFVGNLTVV